MESTKYPVPRSQVWFSRKDKDGFVHRSLLKNQGYPHSGLDGRNVIGICNTWSELMPCNGHFRELAELVSRGVHETDGFPLEFPVMSLGEAQLCLTAMLFSNLASMDVEESNCGNPIDGVVPLMGCDKTTPSLLMDADPGSWAAGSTSTRWSGRSAPRRRRRWIIEGSCEGSSSGAPCR